MRKREYFEVNLPKDSDDLKLALSVCLGPKDNQRYSLDGNFVIIKTTDKKILKKIKKGFKYNQIFPKNKTRKLTYKQALKLAKSGKYQKKIIL